MKIKKNINELVGNGLKIIVITLFLTISAYAISSTNTGFRAPYFVSDDGNFNSSNLNLSIINTTGVLPNASIPLSAANLSAANNTFTGNVSAKNIGGVIYADQYATLQDAINALDSSRTYKQTVKVRGTYTLTTQLNVSNFTVLDLTDAKLIMGPGANVGAIRNKNWGENDIDHDIDIIGGEIDGSAMTAETDDGMVSLRGGYNFSVRNMYVHNGWGFGGIYVTGSNHEISGNTISNMRHTTDQYGTGIYVTGTGTYNIKVSDNDIINNAGTGIFLEDRTNNVTVSNNYLKNNSNGINSDASNQEPGNRNIIIMGNNIPSSRDRCILFGTTNHSIITANICGGGGLYDNIYISGSYNNSVTNNIVINAGYDGISLSATTSENIVTDNFGDDTQTTHTQGYHILDSGVRNIVYNNYLSSRYRIGTLSSGTGVYRNNYGASPFDFGNSATAPAAFGFGDTYKNSTSLDFTCGYTGTQWQNSTGNTDVC